MLHFGRKQAYSPLSALQSPSVNSRILLLVMVCFTFLLYTYECFIRLKFVTETDIILSMLKGEYSCVCERAFEKLGRIGDLVRVACVWLYINSKNT